MENIEIQVEADDVVINEKQPWVGAYLNFFGFSGLGYFYSKNYCKGLIVLCLWAILWTLFFRFLFIDQIPFVQLVVLGAYVLPFLLKLYVTIDVFRIIKKQNSDEYESTRKLMKDPWRAVFFSFLWPGLGHLYLRREGLFIVISLLNIVALRIVGMINSSVLGYFISSVVLFDLYCGIFALHCYVQSSSGISKKYKVKHVLWAILYRGLCWGIVFVFMLLFFQNIGKMYQIPSDSMAPTINAGDRVFVSKIAYRNSLPVTGDLVVFQKESQSSPYIKRIVAVGGQEVQVNEEGILLVDGKEFKYDNAAYLVDQRALRMLKNRKFLKNGRYQVPDGCYYVIGDNYSDSMDSRDFGPLEKKDIIGKAIRIIPNITFD